MKKTTLTAPSHPTELSLQILIAARADAAKRTAQRVSRAAQKTRKYAQTIHQRHRQRGYKEGKEEAHREFNQWCCELPRLYKDVATVAHRDSQQLATLLAEQLLELHITQIPDSLTIWLNRASEILASSRTLKLLYHRRLSAVFSQLAARIPPHVVVQENPDQHCPDFVLHGDTGTVEFAWRLALDQITQANLTRE
jgi:hypothetical protein